MPAPRKGRIDLILAAAVASPAGLTREAAAEAVDITVLAAGKSLDRLTKQGKLHKAAVAGHLRRWFATIPQADAWAASVVRPGVRPTVRGDVKWPKLSGEVDYSRAKITICPHRLAGRFEPSPDAFGLGFRAMGIAQYLDGLDGK